ncbi:TetR/AcrR family transcriptional regulator [Gordonia sp. X0973]|nr:TetR/AcrR family transcriptional regulator [Gordonia sp. X0973]
MSPAARREQFIALGRDLVKRVSAEKVSIESVAQAAGVSRALVFHYFASKQEFHVALAQAQADELLSVVQPDPAIAEPVEVLRASMNAYLDFVTENRHAYTAFLRGTAAADPQMRRIVDTTRSRIAAMIQERTVVFADWTPTAELAVRGWFAFVDEIALIWLDGSRLTRAEVLDLAVESLLALAPVTGAVDDVRTADGAPR